MNYKAKLITVYMVAGLLASPFVFAESSPKEIFNQCKSKANEEVIPLEQMQQYLRQCMEEAGIDAADVDNTLQEMMPAPGNDESTPSDDESRT